MNHAARASSNAKSLSFAVMFCGTLPVNSLGVPITRKSILVRPHHGYPPQKLSGCLAPPNFNVRGHSSGIWSTALEPGIHGGGGGSCTRVFPLLLSAVSDYILMV